MATILLRNLVNLFHDQNSRKAEHYGLSHTRRELADSLEAYMDVEQAFLDGLDRVSRLASVAVQSLDEIELLVVSAREYPRRCALDRVIVHGTLDVDEQILREKLERSGFVLIQGHTYAIPPPPEVKIVPDCLATSGFS